MKTKSKLREKFENILKDLVDNDVGRYLYIEQHTIPDLEKLFKKAFSEELDELEGKSKVYVRKTLYKVIEGNKEKEVQGNEFIDAVPLSAIKKMKGRIKNG